MTAQSALLSPVDYLLIGHITQDLDKDGGRHLGGTVSFAGGTARALGCKTGIVTSVGPEADLSPLDGIEIVCLEAPISTTFENRYSDDGRTQYLHHCAKRIKASDIPVEWIDTPIVHLGPLLDEIELQLLDQVTDSFVGLTPQGWLRKWDATGLVSRAEWKAAAEVLPLADATVISIEDIENDWKLAREWAARTHILVVTQADKGATFFVDGKSHQLSAPHVEVVDPTGAGDIFAAALFARYRDLGDVLAAGRFAIKLATASVTRRGMDSWPLHSEIETALSLVGL